MHPLPDDGPPSAQKSPTRHGTRCRDFYSQAQAGGCHSRQSGSAVVPSPEGGEAPVGSWQPTGDGELQGSQ